MPKSKEFVTDSSSSDDDQPKKKKPKTEKKKAEAAGSSKGGGDVPTKFELSKNRFVTVSEFRGRKMVDVREFYDADGVLKPGKKDCSNYAAEAKASQSSPGPSGAKRSKGSPGNNGAKTGQRSPGPSGENTSNDSPRPSATKTSKSSPGPSAAKPSKGSPGSTGAKTSQTSPGPSGSKRSKGSPGNASAKTSQTSPGPSAAKTSEGTPENASAKTSQTSPGPSAAKTSKGTPGNASAKTSQTSPGPSGSKRNKGSPGNTGAKTSQTSPGPSAAKTSKRTPGRSEAKSSQTSAGPSGAKSSKTNNEAGAAKPSEGSNEANVPGTSKDSNEKNAAGTSKSQTSLSADLRKLGNKAYMAASNAKYNWMKHDKLLEAIKHYYRAYEEAVDQDEKASASKNHGLASWRLGELKHMEKQDTLIYYFKQGINYLDKAIQHGKTAKTCDWCDETASKLIEALQGLQDYLEDVPGKKSRKADLLVAVARDLSFEPAKLDVFLNCGMTYFHEGVRSREQGDFKTGIQLVCEATYPLEECKRLSKKCSNVHVEEESIVLEEDLYMLRCTLDSLQAIDIGNKLLESVGGYEDLPVDLIWQAVDSFKQASLATRELEIEMEAICLARLGYAYAKILKIEYRARECFVTCFQLTSSLAPKSFEQEEWYKEAKFLLSNLQLERQEAERKKHEEDRKKYLEELKNELKILSEKSNECHRGVVFLEFIYKEHPPKDGRFKMRTRHKEETKKALQMAITHYHPDRQKEEDGMKWKVLCEEITKYLTKKYECMKGE